MRLVCSLAFGIQQMLYSTKSLCLPHAAALLRLNQWAIAKEVVKVQLFIQPEHSMLEIADLTNPLVGNYLSKTANS